MQERGIFRSSAKTDSAKKKSFKSNSLNTNPEVNVEVESKASVVISVVENRAREVCISKIETSNV
jgi:hypothetical protein